MKKAGKKKNNFFKKTLIILLFLFIGFISLSATIALAYRWINPPITFLMIYRKIENGEQIRHKWVEIKDISPYVINCVVASEDNHFLSHNGIDYRAISKALEERKTTGRIRGASTISQQTAKNVFLWQKQSFFRKGLELYFTYLIEFFWSKERIMEVYLNVIEMGKGIYGIEAAANSYFYCSAKSLTPYQSALIVSALPSPLKFYPARPSGYLSQRANDILSLSYKIGTIRFDKESIEAAKKRYRERYENK